MDITKLKYNSKKLQNSQVEIDVIVNEELFEEARKNEVKNLSKKLSLKGFRKGHVPKQLAEVQVGYDAINNAINNLIPKVAESILKEEKLFAMDTIKYSNVKLGDEIVAEGDEAESKKSDNSIHFTMTLTVIPNVTLPNIESLKIEKPSTEVTDSDVEKVLEDYKSTREQAESAAKEKGESFDEKKYELPNKEDLKKDLENHKKQEAEAQYTQNILDELVAKSEFEFPELIVEAEIEAQEQSFRSRVEQIGLNIEQYLQMQGQTIEDLRKIWEDNFRKSMSISLVLREYIKANQIEVTQTELENTLKDMSAEERAEFNSVNALQNLLGYLSQNKAVAMIKEKLENKSK